MKRPAAVASVLQPPAKRARGEDPVALFWHYAEQVDLKEAGGKVSDQIVADYGFPPTDLRRESNVKYNQTVLVPMAGKSTLWKLILTGTFQAPDNPWCFSEVLLPFVKGVKAQQRGNKAETKKYFDAVGRILQTRYVRGIPKEDLASGKRKGTVNGYGDVGLYSGEHQTAILHGMTHPQGLRWKLEHWPHWIEHALLPLLQGWPKASDESSIDEMLKERFPKNLPDGVATMIVPRHGARPVRILDLFGGNKRYATSMLSQALLFQEMLKPSDKLQRSIRGKYGWGVGPFTVRGLWMECNRCPAMCKSFPQFDTSTFCPGFVGALAGVQECNLEKASGVSLSPRKEVPDGSINWSSWEVQVRFAAWMYALQAAKPSRDLHCTEAEATLCFFSRYAKMRRLDPKSQQYCAAARAIGENLDPKIVRKLFDKDLIKKAAAVIARK